MTFNYSVDLYPDEGEEVLLSNVSLWKLFVSPGLMEERCLLFHL